MRPVKRCELPPRSAPINVARQTPWQGKSQRISSRDMPRVAKSLPKGSTAASEGEKTHRSVDLLGRVYEYFLTRFASAEGKNGGQFYTPSYVVRCLVEPVPVRKDLAPYKGRIYDPACGSGGRFVQSIKFVEAHGGTAQRDSASSESEATLPSLSAAKGNRPNISIYGQESNATTRRLAVMNLAPQGMAGFVLANGSMSSNQSGNCTARSALREWATNSQGLGSQRDIRRALIAS
jgi:type I restriction-modification system DNA methylase subunit